MFMIRRCGAVEAGVEVLSFATVEAEVQQHELLIYIIQFIC
jgi:hypothetical protein